MRVAYRRASFFAAATVLIGVAACSKSKPMDDGLKQDLAATASNGLELAPNSAKQQVVVSAIEGGPESAPTPAARRIIPKPTPKPAPRLASNTNPAEAPMPAPMITQSAPSAPAQQASPAPETAKEPAPLPPLSRPGQAQQKGVYKSEGEIFRQMPWIKP